jgi:hypothetical protein
MRLTTTEFERALDLLTATEKASAMRLRDGLELLQSDSKIDCSRTRSEHRADYLKLAAEIHELRQQKRAGL